MAFFAPFTKDFFTLAVAFLTFFFKYLPTAVLKLPPFHPAFLRAIYSPSCNRLAASLSISCGVLPSAHPDAATLTTFSLNAISWPDSAKIFSQVGKVLIACWPNVSHVAVATVAPPTCVRGGQTKCPPYENLSPAGGHCYNDCSCMPVALSNGYMVSLWLVASTPTTSAKPLSDFQPVTKAGYLPAQTFHVRSASHPERCQDSSLRRLYRHGPSTLQVQRCPYHPADSR